MKKSFILLSVSILFSIAAQAQTKKDGTPDMRYKSNKETYGNSYQTPAYSAPSNSSYSTPKYATPSYEAPKQQNRNYNNGGQLKVQDGYQKSNGTYVAPHFKSSPDNHKYNNYKKR